MTAVCLASGRLLLLADGHGKGQLRGLATHPADPDVYATVGDDAFVRVGLDLKHRGKALCVIISAFLYARKSSWTVALTKKSFPQVATRYLRNAWMQHTVQKTAAEINQRSVTSKEQRTYACDIDHAQNRTHVGKGRLSRIPNQTHRDPLREGRSVSHVENISQRISFLKHTPLSSLQSYRCSRPASCA